jgi:hypothetical protein
VLGKRFENTVKISSAPAETIALLVPYYPWNDKNIDSIEALRPNILRSWLGNIETSWSEFFPEVFDLGEEEVNVSFLYNRDKNMLVSIQGFSN